MTRGFFATAPAVALMLALYVPGAYAQHGQSGGHPAPPAPHAVVPAPHAPSPTTTAHGGSATSTTTATRTTTTSTTAGKTTTVTTTGTLTPVQQKLTTNTNLASKLSSRLPAGTNLLTAAQGFRNLGQFVAAVNVSRNLGIPFASLRTDMVVKHMSLGQSIQALRPSANGTLEAEHAEAEARTLVIQTQSTTARPAHRTTK